MSSDSSFVAGRYRLESVLGQGGMGTVWTGRDELLGRQVAIKEVRIPPGLSEHDRDVLHRRMMREARLTARLNDTRIITVYDVVLHDGRPFIVMEHVASRSLDQELDQSGPLPPPRVATIGLELLAALDLAHAEGIVHRDVKPSNVLLAADGRVVLTDFGIATTESDAALTSTGLLVGSPTYMSPERLRGEEVGPAADLWSLGATLYAASEGHPPFRSNTTMGTITAVLTDDVAPPTTQGALSDALLGMLRKQSGQRLASAQVRALLKRAAAEPGGATTTMPAPTVPAPAPVMAPAVGPGYVWETEQDPPAIDPEPDQPRPSGRSRPVLLLVALAVVAVIVGGIVGVILAGSDDSTGSAADGQTTPASEGTGSGKDTSEPPTTTPSSPPTSDPTPSDPTTTPTDEPTDKPTDNKTDVPAGYKLRTDPLGFQVAIPKGWERRVNSASAIDFVSPEGTSFLRIDQVSEAGADATQAWLDAEPSVRERLSGYQRIRIEPVDYRWPAADWEFTFEGSGGTIHVLDRGFITEPRGFAVYMSAPDTIWESEALPVFEAAADTFEPID